MSTKNASYKIDEESVIPPLPPSVLAAQRSMRLGFVPSLAGLSLLFFGLLAGFAHYAEENFNDAHVQQYYSYLADVIIMVLVGFGFLMTFLRRYAYSAVGLTFVLSCFVMVEAVLAIGWAQQGAGSIEVELPLLIDAAFCAGAAMISFGAVIGFASPTQLLWLMFIEVIIYAANMHLVVSTLGAFDIGGSITIHVFGAFYGLAASFFLSRSSRTRGSSHPKNGSTYTTDITAMIGTLFLFIYWPSFNGALASAPGEDTQHQVYCIANTLISLFGAVMTTFVVSAAVNGSFDMVYVQNATLAGGVAMGTSSFLRMAPAAALGIGMLAGILSTLGYVYASPLVEKKLGLCDTCGVFNLHGMPGLLGGLVSAVLASVYYEDNAELMTHAKGSQSAYQIAGLFATLGIALTAGGLAGFIVSYVHLPGGSDNDDERDSNYEDSYVWTTGHED